MEVVRKTTHVSRKHVPVVVPESEPLARPCPIHKGHKFREWIPPALPQEENLLSIKRQRDRLWAVCRMSS